MQRQSSATDNEVAAITQDTAPDSVNDVDIDTLESTPPPPVNLSPRDPEMRRHSLVCLCKMICEIIIIKTDCGGN
jgi:hypothetical protein